MCSHEDHEIGHFRSAIIVRFHDDSRNGIIAMEALPRYYLPDEQFLVAKTILGRDKWAMNIGWDSKGPGVFHSVSSVLGRLVHG